MVSLRIGEDVIERADGSFIGVDYAMDLESYCQWRPNPDGSITIERQFQVHVNKWAPKREVT